MQNKLNAVINKFLAIFVLAAHFNVHGATVFSSTTPVDVTSNPNAAPAIVFTGPDYVQISTPLITGDITTTGIEGGLLLNGTTTINGNIGSPTNPVTVAVGTSLTAVTGIPISSPRFADGNVYTLNGTINSSAFFINLGDGLPFSSTLVLGGNLNVTNQVVWHVPNAGKLSTLDLQGNAVTAAAFAFRAGGGVGDLRLISTITAAGGQTSCTASSNKAGCISTTLTDNIPANLLVQVRVANGVTLATGTKYTLVDFASGNVPVPTLSSSIAALTAGFSFVQDTTNTEDLVFEVTGLPITIPFFVSNSNVLAKPAAAMLDGLSATASDPGMIAAITALQGLSGSAQAAVLNRLAAQTSRANVVAGMQTINGALDSVQLRLEDAREQGFDTGLAAEMQQGKLKLAANGDVSGLVDASRQHGFWIKGFGAHGDQNNSSNYAGYNSNTWGTVFGADTLLTNNWLVGAALTYARTGVNMTDFRSGDDTNINTYQLTGYASRDFGNWYLDGMLAYAKQDYDTSRNTNLTGVARGDFNGDQYATRIHVGKHYALGNNLNFTPIAGLEWNRLNQDSYTEKGAGALSLRVNSEQVDRVRSMLGAKLSAEKAFGNYAVIPSMHFAWRHDFKDNGLDITSTFTGGGAAFTTPGQDLARNTFNVGAAVALQKTKDFTFNIRLDSESASGYQGFSGQVMGQWKF